LVLPGEVLVIGPEAVRVGDSVKLAAYAVRKGTAVPDLIGVEWSATGGTIDPRGVYTASVVPGTYTVTAAVKGKVLATAPVAVYSALGGVDSVLATLQSATVVFGVPDSIQLGRSGRVALTVLPTVSRASVESVRSELRGSGLRTGTRPVKVGDRMTATVWAYGILAEPGSDIVPVSSSRPTSWSRRLIAESTGTRPVSLRASTALAFSGDQVLQPVLELDTTVVVWQTAWQGIKANWVTPDVVRNVLAGAVGGLLALLGRTILRRWTERRRSRPPGGLPGTN
jgi:hypothetical protein